MFGGLLAAADRGEGGTLYRYREPESEGARAREQARARLSRRFRLAPPGAAELRQRLGLHALHHGPGGRGLARGGGGPGQGAGGDEEEEEEMGFTVVAADSACRPAVGTVALPSAQDGSSSGAGGAGGTARAAAVLDANGQLRLLRQRWPKCEPALHQLCAFSLGEPAVALLPGSLADPGERGGGASGAAAAGSAAGSMPGMAAVTAAGGAVALLPLEASQAEQLALLQRALVQHPGAAPLSAGRFTAFRGTCANGSGPCNGGPPALAFVHPPPTAPDPAMAGLLGPALAEAPEGSEQAAAAAAAAAAAPAGLGTGPGEEPGSSTPRAQRGPAADGRPSSGGSSSGAGQPQQAQQAACGAVLDAELLQDYLLMPPAEQRSVLVAAGVVGSDGASRLAAQLSNLAAQLLL